MKVKFFSGKELRALLVIAVLFGLSMVTDALPLSHDRLPSFAVEINNARFSPSGAEGGEAIHASAGGEASLPDITPAGIPTVSGILVVGDAIVFGGSMQNSGDSNIMGTFDNMYQIDLGNDDTFDMFVDAPDSMTGLTIGETKTISAPPWIIGTAGTHAVRMCGDYNSSWVGTIPEKEDSHTGGNNCSEKLVFTIDPAFAFQINPISDQTIGVTNTKNVPINLTRLAGLTEVVTLSASGFPPGATHSWPSGDSCSPSPTCSQTLRITTSGVSPRTDTITVTGTSVGASATETFDLIVAPACSDGVDNDSDGKIDEDDPGCWTIAGDPLSYDGTINSEITDPAVLTLTADGEAPVIRILRGERAVIDWVATNIRPMPPCTVTGTNGDSWSGPSGNEPSSIIEDGPVDYTLSCLNLDGDPVSLKISVKLIPSFEEF